MTLHSAGQQTGWKARFWVRLQARAANACPTQGGHCLLQCYFENFLRETERLKLPAAPTDFADERPSFDIRAGNFKVKPNMLPWQEVYGRARKYKLSGSLLATCAAQLHQVHPPRGARWDGLNRSRRVRNPKCLSSRGEQSMDGFCNSLRYIRKKDLDTRGCIPLGYGGDPQPENGEVHVV